MLPPEDHQKSPSTRLQACQGNGPPSASSSIARSSTLQRPHTASPHAGSGREHVEPPRQTDRSMPRQGASARSGIDRDVGSLTKKIDVAFDKGDYGTVITLCQVAMSMFSEDVPAAAKAKIYMRRGDALLTKDNGDHNLALADAKAAVALWPRSAEAWGLLGRAHEQLGDMEKYQEALDVADKLTREQRLEEMLAGTDDLLAHGLHAQACKQAKSGAQLCITNQCPELRPAFFLRWAKASLCQGEFEGAQQQAQEGLGILGHAEDEGVKSSAGGDGSKEEDRAALRKSLEEVLLAAVEERVPPGATPSPEVQGAPHEASGGDVPSPAPPSALPSAPLPAPTRHPSRHGFRQPSAGALFPSSFSEGGGTSTGAVVGIAVSASAAVFVLAALVLLAVCHGSKDATAFQCFYTQLRTLREDVEFIFQLWTGIVALFVTVFSWLAYNRRHH